MSSKASRNGGGANSRDSSFESEDGHQQQQNIPIGYSAGSGNYASETSGNETNSIAIRSGSPVYSSAPPSYERVLEETRLEYTANRIPDDEIEEDSVEQGRSANQTNALVANGAAGGGGGGGGGRDNSSGRRQPAKGPEILHKSSKELYRAVAKQWGLTCKMSDECRCLDCQSHYFDCEYERNEQELTDGGLGAGAPMFISEVMHGTACSLL